MKVKDLEVGGNYKNVRKITIYKDWEGQEIMQLQLTANRTVTRNAEGFEVLSGEIQLGFGFHKPVISLEDYRNGNYEI